LLVNVSTSFREHAACHQFFLALPLQDSRYRAAVAITQRAAVALTQRGSCTRRVGLRFCAPRFAFLRVTRARRHNRDPQAFYAEPITQGPICAASSASLCAPLGSGSLMIGAPVRPAAHDERGGVTKLHRAFSRHLALNAAARSMTQHTKASASAAADRTTPTA
jgi:hypothetical protein